MHPDITEGVPSAPPLIVVPPMASPLVAPPSVTYNNYQFVTQFLGTPPLMSSGTWTSGLWGCLEDPSNCFITLFCPCVTFGQNAEIIDRRKISCVCAGAICCLFLLSLSSCWYTCTYRSKLRGQTTIPGDQCADCCVHFWCPLCALCQESRELKNRGLDPSIGWIANAEKGSQQIGVAMPPVVPAGMIR